IRSSAKPPIFERSLWQVTQYLSSIARQFAAAGSGARVAWVCAASDTCAPAKITTKDDFAINEKGRIQRSTRNLTRRTLRGGKKQTTPRGASREPVSSTRPVYRKASRLTISAVNFSPAYGAPRARIICDRG